MILVLSSSAGQEQELQQLLEEQQRKSSPNYHRWLITAQSDIELTDVQQFRQIFALQVNEPNFIVSGPDQGVTSQIDAQEAQLDVEWQEQWRRGQRLT